MEEYMHMITHHGDAFINNDLAMYKRGRVKDVK